MEPAPCRFAILEHDWPALHWDLFLEEADHLRAWRLLDDPRKSGSLRVEASAPHRKAYLDYEGPVADGRGRVEAIDRGHFRILMEERGRLVVELDGELFRKRFELASFEGRDQFRWLDADDTTAGPTRDDGPCECPTTTS